MLAEQEPHLDVPAARPQRAHRGDGRVGGPDGVEGHVGAAAGGVDHAAYGVGPALDEHLGAQLPGEPEGGPGHVDGDDAGAERGRDHHRRQAHAATAVDRHPVAGTDPAVGGQGAVGGREAAPQRRGGDEVQVVGQRDHVEVGRRHGDEVGERPRLGEPRLRLVRHTWASPAAQ